MRTVRENFTCASDFSTPPAPFAAGDRSRLYSAIPPVPDDSKMSDVTSSGRSNRRVTARKACLLTVRYRSVGDWHPATAMDLSPHGCRLRVGEDLPRGKGVHVAF